MRAMRAPAQPRGTARGRRRTLHRLSHTACSPMYFVRRDEASRPRRRERRLLPSLLQPASATTPTVRTLRPTGADRPQRNRRPTRSLRQLLPRTRHDLLALRPHTPLPTGQQRGAHLPHLLRPRGTTPQSPAADASAISRSWRTGRWDRSARAATQQSCVPRRNAPAAERLSH